MACSARYLQPYCYISTDVAEEALMASRAATDVQVIHVTGSNPSPKLLPQLPLLLCSSCAVCNLETVVFGFIGQRGRATLFNQSVTSPHKGRSRPACRSKWTAFHCQFLKAEANFFFPLKSFPSL